MCVCSVMSNSATPWTVDHQALLSVEFPRQEYWTMLLFPSPGDLPDPEIKPMSLASPALAGRFFTTAPPGRPFWLIEKVFTIMERGKAPFFHGKNLRYTEVGANIMNSWFYNIYAQIWKYLYMSICVNTYTHTHIHIYCLCLAVYWECLKAAILQ